MLTWNQYHESPNHKSLQLQQQQAQQPNFPHIEESPLQQDVTLISKMCRNLQTKEAFDAVYAVYVQLKNNL